MKTAARRDLIVATLTGPDTMFSVHGLQAVLLTTRALHVAESTLRRDLWRLSTAGRVRKAGETYSGAACWTAVSS